MAGETTSSKYPREHPLVLPGGYGEPRRCVVRMTIGGMRPGSIVWVVGSDRAIERANGLELVELEPKPVDDHVEPAVEEPLAGDEKPDGGAEPDESGPPAEADGGPPPEVEPGIEPGIEAGDESGAPGTAPDPSAEPAAPPEPEKKSRRRSPAPGS